MTTTVTLAAHARRGLTMIGEAVGEVAECFLEQDCSVGYLISRCRIPVVGRGRTHCTDVPCQLLVASVLETNA